MKRTVRLFSIVAMSLGLAGAAHAQDSAKPEGTWTGTSTCTEYAGWCQDEDVVFHIRPGTQPLTYDVEMDTVANGVESPESRLTMVYKTGLHTLTARFYDEQKRSNFWVLAVKGDTMTGLLMIDNRIIQRNLHLVRKTDSPPDASSSGAFAASSSAASSAASSAQ